MATISGTNEAEILPNNAGVSDTITGLAGHDTFVYTRSGAAETDTLTDFGSTYFGATIDAAQEVPAGSSTATGSLSGALSRGQDHFAFSISEHGLDLGGQTGSTADDVTAAHFHSGAPGVSGGVVFGFIGAPNNDTDGDTSIDASDGEVFGEWDAAEGLTGQLSNLLAGNLYVNFHTTTHSGGAIRGQILSIDSGLDRIDVTAANIGSWETMQLLLQESGGTAQFATAFNGQLHTMKMTGVAIADLSEDDFIFAGNASQTINGTANPDDLFGAGGSDTLKGSGGVDVLYGETGGDTLVGGAALDVLYGGTSADKFVFNKLSESKVGAGHRDIVKDFHHGEHDKINVHKIDADTAASGNQDFHLVGAFTNDPRQLIQVSSGGKTVISGDVNGDGHADFQIELTGTITLVNGDFVF